MSEIIISKGHYSYEFSDAALYMPKLEVVGTLVDRLDSTIHGTNFSCS